MKVNNKLIYFMSPYILKHNIGLSYNKYGHKIKIIVGELNLSITNNYHCYESAKSIFNKRMRNEQYK